MTSTITYNIHVHGGQRQIEGDESMGRNLDLGFRSDHIKEENYPIFISFRGNEEIEKQLQHIKDFMATGKGSSPAISMSDVLRKAVRFAHIYCLQREAEAKEREELQAKKRLKALSTPDVFVIEGKNEVSTKEEK